MYHETAIINAENCIGMALNAPSIAVFTSRDYMFIVFNYGNKTYQLELDTPTHKWCITLDDEPLTVTISGSAGHTIDLFRQYLSEHK